MESDRQDTALYYAQLDGGFDPLREHGFFTDVLVSWMVEGDAQAGIVRVTPQQVERLHQLLHVQRVEPAGAGLYVSRTGHWYAIRDGALVQSGWEGIVPREALEAALSETQTPAAAPALTVPAAPPEPISQPAPAPTPMGVPSGAMERDPVCGLEIRPGLEGANANYQGRTYHFCSAECRDRFLREPAQYLAAPV